MPVDCRETRAGKFPNRLRCYRLGRGLSQRDLAQQLGRTQSAVSRLERGEHPLKSPIIDKLTALFQCTYDDLIAQ
jgi:transcriptional regulator with XRE-family HTH domain